MAKNGMRPIHPGEILREEFLAPINMSVNALANHLHVPATRMNEIVRGRRGITPDTALRLAAFFGGDAMSWLNLQQVYDLKNAEAEAAKRIKIFKGYQINQKLVALAKPDALVMHCLPAYKGKEIDEATFEAYAQTIFDQAENRLHVQKAVLAWVLG